MKTIRRIPSENEISVGLRRLGNSKWSTVYARLLVYGLRPHEAFLGRVEANGMFVVPENTKTGHRFVPPFQRGDGWLRLVNGQLPTVSAKENRIYGVRTWQAFKRYDIGFNPYDLRHRFVVLTEEQGIPPAIAASWSGHSCRTRYQIYTKTLDQRRALAYAQQHGYLLDNSNHTNNLHVRHAV